MLGGKNDQAVDKNGVRVSAIDTIDTLDEWSGRLDLSAQAEAATSFCESLSVVSDDDYANTSLQLKDAPTSRGPAVPQNIVIVSDSLRSALSDAEQAAQFFLENVDDLRLVESATLKEFVGEVHALKHKFLEQILPKVSGASGRCSKVVGEQHCLQAREVAFVEKSRSGEAMLIKESSSLTTTEIVPSSSLYLRVDPACGTSLLHLSLKELAERTSQEDHPRMLAVFGVDALGIDSLGALRKHFERKGKVEVISQPSISTCTACALVRMEKVTDASAISSAGRHQTLNNVQLVVHRLAEVKLEVPIAD